MREQFLDDNSKAAQKRLLRACGYGVPNLDRAMYSASNSLTLIAQSELQPFDRSEKGSGYRTRDMHLYTLPWPKEALQAMPPDACVCMRVTLSYFIEPGPGEKGWRDRYRYSSHGLRFDVKSPTETKQQFTNRINKQAGGEKDDLLESESSARHWTLGPQARNKGSIHSDIWQGTATDLASSNLISITPVIGWWRERHHLGKWNRRTRYALIVSISTDEETIDIYTPVAIQVGVSVPVEIET